jgi:nickel/cobalt transporter (NicO) family protein
MHSNPLPLLLGAAAIVALLHSILPDHWVPLAIVARTQRWNLPHVAWVSGLASLGHVLASLVLGGIVALVGLQFQHELETQQGRIISGILVLTGLGFLIWGLTGRSHNHRHARGHTHDAVIMHRHSHAEEHEHHHAHQEHSHTDPHDEYNHAHIHESGPEAGKKATGQRLAAILVPFGVAASPDLTILPVALAASAVGGGAVASVLGVFALLTIGTFIGLTVLATLAGYQIKGAWLENNANTISSLVLIALGIVAYVGF